MRIATASHTPITPTVWRKGFALAHYLLLASAALLAVYDKASI